MNAEPTYAVPMNILGIDCSQGTALAVVVDGKTVACRADAAPRHHVESIGVLIKEVLVAAGLTAARLDGLAVGTGPGGFSGLRVGIATALGLGLGADIPVWGIGTHAALAFGLAPEHGPVTIATDARRHEYFVTEFSGLDEHGLPIVATPAHTTSEVPEGALIDPVVDASWVANYAAAASAAGVPLQLPRPQYVRSPDVAPPTRRLQ